LVPLFILVLVRMLPDGTLEIFGRADNQIKLRGVRIESEGISNVFRMASEAIGSGPVDAYTFLGKNPAFSSQQLITLVSPPGKERIPTSVKKSGNYPLILKDPLLVQRLNAAARKELATYMVPAHVIPVKWIPISSNGKADDKLMKEFFASLDISILSNLTREPDEDTGEQLSNHGDIEEKLTQLISRITFLSSEDLNPNYHYFACGLDSLQLIRLSSGIHSEFDTLISVSDLIRHPTIRKTSQLIKDMGNVSHVGDEERWSEQMKRFAQEMELEATMLRPLSDIEHIYPTFPVQEGVLFSSLEDATQYAQHFIFRLHESVEMSRLRNAWRTAQGHLAILRYGQG
jgi:ferricrocin synthase